ncbi:MAG: hypothetical protein ED557_06180 [Balneola sp.]|nr:MAG: hypothetical protein ED557_06180 [Balneola sp.]
MPLTKVLIAVKTYPTLSSKYEELVCTAGFLENGDWIRIYPVPFRKKSFNERYRKYEWIELDLVKNTADFRPESYRPWKEDTEINIFGHLDTKGNWYHRKKYALKKVYTNMRELISEAKDKSIGTSLATFKPRKILDFTIEQVEREWSPEKLALLNQYGLFEETSTKEFKVVKKLPYKFSYKFEDEEGKVSTLMNEDWEIGQLYWKMLAKYEGDEHKACIDVKKKYLDDFANTKDLYLFLGTTKANHFRGLNPFIIIGTFHPKIETQGSLF